MEDPREFRVTFTIKVEATKNQFLNDLEFALDTLPLDGVDYSEIEIEEIEYSG